MKVRRGIRIATVLALAAPALITIAPGTASAYPQVCRPYEKWASIASVRSYKTPTHMEGVSLAPGAGFHQSATITRELTVSAGLEASSEATAKAGVVLAKASVTVGAKLSAAGSKTNTKSITRAWDIPAGKGQRRYILWSGVYRYNGGYVYHVCNASGRAYSTSKGTWRSFRTVWYGTALCGYPYKAGTFEANAVRMGGC